MHHSGCSTFYSFPRSRARVRASACKFQFYLAYTWQVSEVLNCLMPHGSWLMAHAACRMPHAVGSACVPCWLLLALDCQLWHLYLSLGHLISFDSFNLVRCQALNCLRLPAASPGTATTSCSSLTLWELRTKSWRLEMENWTENWVECSGKYFKFSIYVGTKRILQSCKCSDSTLSKHCRWQGQ